MRGPSGEGKTGGCQRKCQRQAQSRLQGSRIQANVSVAFAGHQKSGTQYGTATLSSPPREKWLRWNVCTEDGSIVAMIGLQDVMWKRRRGEEEEKA